MNKKKQLLSRFLLLSILNYQTLFNTYTVELFSSFDPAPSIFLSDKIAIIQIPNKKKKDISTVPALFSPIMMKEDTSPSNFEHSRLGKRMASLSGILLYGERGAKDETY